MRPSRIVVLLFAMAGLIGVGGCGWIGGEGVAEEFELGPHDGHDLPGVDLERVKVGHTAPDFTLASYAGETVTLSDFRGRENVVLVFYRGHW